MPARRKTRPPPEEGNGDSLAQYRAKRAFDQTPEPGGLVPKPAPKPGGLLIVHMHDATRLHWDLRLDRKSTRLNSSHLGISYAVFCLKKKKKNKRYIPMTSK